MPSDGSVCCVHNRANYKLSLFKPQSTNTPTQYVRVPSITQVLTNLGKVSEWQDSSKKSQTQITNFVKQENALFLTVKNV